MTRRLPAAWTPSSAMDTHLDLIDALRPGAIVGTTKGGHPLTVTDFWHRWREGLPSGAWLDAPDIQRAVGEADTFLVTGEMLQVASEASVDLDGMPLFPADMPSQNMLVFLDDIGLTYFDPFVEEPSITAATVRAIHLMRLPLRHRNEDGTESMVDGMSYFVWADAEEMHNQWRDQVGEEGLPDFLPDIAGLFPLDVTGWGFGQQWRSLTEEEAVEHEGRSDEREPTPPGTVMPHVGALRRFLTSLLLLMGEEVYYERERVDRPTRRRMERKAHVPYEDDFTVGVTRLRRFAHSDSDVEPEGGWLHHRFYVRGHWRRLHRGTPEERAVWVRPYIKGPDDAPLIEKFRVTALDR